jgi:hypothetical protein
MVLGCIVIPKKTKENQIMKTWEAVFKIKGVNQSEDMSQDRDTLLKVIAAHNESNLKGNKVELLEITKYFLRVRLTLAEEDCGKGRIDVAKYFANYITRPLYKVYGWNRFSSYPNTLFVTHSCEETTGQLGQQSESDTQMPDNSVAMKAASILFGALKAEADPKKKLTIIESLGKSVKNMPAENVEYIKEFLTGCLDDKDNQIQAATLLLRLGL